MKNVGLLFLCEAWTRTSSIVVLSSMALIGRALTSTPALATLPLAIIPITTLLCTVPAARLMQRNGRRIGFASGACLGIIGGCLCALALWLQNFLLLCIGASFIGAVNGFATYYRFAGGEVVPEALRSKAISIVMAGGIIAAFIGSNIATISRDMIGPHLFIGTYIAVAFLQTLVLLTIVWVKFPKPSSTTLLKKGRPLNVVARQPEVILAVVGAVTSWFVMSLLMNATPLSMDRHMHSFDDTAWVIQWHVLGMFAPAFFTGHIINRFGITKVMAAGILIIFTSVLTNLGGTQLNYYLIGLTLLGLGWNFLFIASTTLLAKSHSPAEKASVQSANDGLIYGLLIITTFGSGPLEQALGWYNINLLTIPIIMGSGLIMFLLSRKTKSTN